MESYPSVEKQLVYSAGSAEWAKKAFVYQVLF